MSIQIFFIAVQIWLLFRIRRQRNKLDQERKDFHKAADEAAEKFDEYLKKMRELRTRSNDLKN
jgi:prefoldin subunit 5